MLVAMLVAAVSVSAQQSKPRAKAVHDSAVAQQTTERAPWVGSSKGKTYYRAGCRGASKLAAKNLISFKSEEDAKKAGYTHSRQRGC